MPETIFINQVYRRKKKILNDVEKDEEKAEDLVVKKGKDSFTS